MDLMTFAVILILHYIGDFLIQTQKMRTKKSSDYEILITHVITYGVVISIIGLFLYAFNKPFHIENFVIWMNANVMIHFLIDFITSKISKRLFDNESYWWGMNIVGLDQILHIFVLYSTFNILLV